MSNRWNSENYLSSTISVTLFYAAGLLPDPDVPYTVTETQSHMWAISLIFEIALLYIQTQALPRPVSVIPGIASFQVALSGLRIVVLCTLVGLYVLTRPINVTGSAEERESLFDEHAQNNTMYGSSPSQAKGATPVRSGDAQTTTWLDYLLGFGRLFPFLWTDALLLYETVHYSSALPTEISRFGKLISSFQKAEYNVFFSLNLLNAVQNGVFTVGVALVCYLNAYQISMDMQPVAMFVTLLTYMAQLQAPLNFFGSFYTQVQNNLVDAERMLNLFKEEPTVVDREGAVELRSCKGNISFSDVSFSYNNNHRALHNISFDVMSGTSTAIVGESGSGKSTILKLLFRFYDVDSGAIKIDGIDIRDMKLESLRDFIGVVPQDTILFNDTVMFNLMYAKPDSTESEVYEACKAASIHDKIIRFPQGYLTSVGERGLKLSGGEKQRIAIARAFLRSPRILLLDEATASLDSQTEKQIQSALAKVSEGRTTLMIAHRLSTIAKADQIIVLHQGGIVERGRHTDLLAKRGYYAQMWEKQMQEEENKE
ncbi:Heavy metal tolerance protein [Daldinia childiae]|uniref:Heavy metal tolerance protein n=1 Tax=Daldinia childiae TaxID=326645 RepID=UPI0014476FA3|nr:Heavy metal tolerance protein [Daldinia childiae]KAF3058034.1 Heavy metal tolerance protein [Daldinia childiae]